MVSRRLLRQRCRPEGYPGLAGAQRHRHHRQHLHAPGRQLQGCFRKCDPFLARANSRLSDGLQEKPDLEARITRDCSRLIPFDEPDLFSPLDRKKPANAGKIKRLRASIRDPIEASFDGEEEDQRSTAEEKAGAISVCFF